jgi:FkbM family methyltransferase
MTELKELPPTWQHRDIERALKYVSDLRLAVDCGAHRGIVTKCLSLHFQSVVAIEPSEFAEGIAFPNVTVVKKALGSAPGRCGMQHGGHNTGQRHVVAGDQYEVITLDSLGLSPTFIKIDVEGCEYATILGAKETIKTHKPVIMFEENGLNARYGIANGRSGRLLESYGMRLLDKWPNEGGPREMEYLYGW